MQQLATPSEARTPLGASLLAQPSDALAQLSLVSVEGIAVQHGILPAILPRAACSAEGEQVLRRLGRLPQTAEPWVPVTTVGPLLVFAHHNPRSQDFWGVPDFLSVKIAISAEQYESVKKDLVMRMTASPIPSHNSAEFLTQPRLNPGDLGSAFEWMAENYPFEANELERLRRNFDEASEKHGPPNEAGYNAIHPHLGVALRYLCTAQKTYCFNPEDAPRQDIFPNQLLEKHNVYPLYLGRQRSYLLSTDLNNYAFEDEWLSTGADPVEMVFVLADGRAIREAIGRNGSTVKEHKVETGGELVHGVNANMVEIEPEDVARVDPGNPNHEPEEILHWVLYTAITGRASDLHLEKYYNMARFRARIDGKLKVIYSCSEETLPRFIALIKNYANMGQSRQEAQDGRIGITIRSRRVDVRVAAVPHRREFQKIIMRFLDKQDGLKQISDLNLSRRQDEIVKRVMGRDQGLILVTGPTGSGKTTTLYALLQSVNDDHVNIQTIEDPIEYEIEGINQTQTDPTYGLDFACGLRALLRADPDVILIGESRDEETARAAVNAALTGHLVLTTLHANDSLRATTRLLSMGVEPYLLCDSLALTQAQRLVRRLCGYCKRAVHPSDKLNELLMRNGIISRPLTEPVYDKVGCAECQGSGYSGRIALMEMCEGSRQLSDLIERGAGQSELRALASSQGVLTLYQEGLLQVVAGNTTAEEIQKLSYTAA